VAFLLTQPNLNEEDILEGFQDASASSNVLNHHVVRHLLLDTRVHTKKQEVAQAFSWACRFHNIPVVREFLDCQLVDDPFEVELVAKVVYNDEDYGRLVISVDVRLHLLADWRYFRVLDQVELDQLHEEKACPWAASATDEEKLAAACVWSHRPRDVSVTKMDALERNHWLPYTQMVHNCLEDELPADVTKFVLDTFV
jgi:hypothetical protein